MDVNVVVDVDGSINQLLVSQYEIRRRGMCQYPRIRYITVEYHEYSTRLIYHDFWGTAFILPLKIHEAAMLSKDELSKKSCNVSFLNIQKKLILIYKVWISNPFRTHGSLR